MTEVLGGVYPFKTLQDVFIHLEICYTLHEMYFFFKRGPLKVSSQM